MMPFYLTIKKSLARNEGKDLIPFERAQKKKKSFGTIKL